MKPNKHLYQDNAITEARYSMTSLEKDVLYMVMCQIGLKDRMQQLYHVSLNDLRRETGNKHLKVNEVRAAVRKLQSKILSVPDPEADFVDVQLLGSAKYLLGSGIIQIAISPEMRPYLFNLSEQYTRYQFQMAVSIRSQYAKRLYEMSSQWLHLQHIPPISVEEIKERLGMTDGYNWTIFEARILKKALKEVTEKSDLKVTYQKMKTGKRYTHIKFEVQRKPAQTEMQFTDSESDLMNRLTNKFRVGSSLAEQIVMNVKKEDITKKLYDIQLMKISIKDIGAYTATVFRKYL